MPSLYSLVLYINVSNQISVSLYEFIPLDYVDLTSCYTDILPVELVFGFVFITYTVQMGLII